MSEPHRHKASSDFSIDRILAADPPLKTDQIQRPDVGDRLSAERYPDKESGRVDEFGQSFDWTKWDQTNPYPRDDLPWLRCTRYKPPKLPRKSGNGKSAKRRLGSHPRIPFTKFQLEVLEDKYKNGAYLTRKDVVQLSGVLHLPQNRVKIWFQNRRARERKESRSVEFHEETKHEREGMNND